MKELIHKKVTIIRKKWTNLTIPSVPFHVEVQGLAMCPKIQESLQEYRLQGIKTINSHVLPSQNPNNRFKYKQKTSTTWAWSR